MAFVISATAISSWPAHKSALIVAAVAAACYMYPSSQTEAEDLVGRPRIVDGDTLVINRQRVRLRAVDAPEMAQICQRGDQEERCGVAARDALERWLLESGGVAHCEGKRRDGYGRLVAFCTIGDEDVGKRLVREGYAVAYRRYGSHYVQEEDEARTAGRGIWSTKFQMPEEWRRQHRHKR